MSVLVYAENWDGSFKKAVFEAVSFGYAVAQALGKDCQALIAGNVSDEEAQKLGQYGASQINRVNRDALNPFKVHEHAQVLAQAANDLGADVITFAGTTNGKSLGPRVAAKLDAAVATGAVDLLEGNAEGITIKKPVFSSKGFAKVKLKGKCNIIGVEPNAYGDHENPVDATIEDKDYQVEDPGFTFEVFDREMIQGKIPLPEAEKVVSGGRGMKGPDNWGMLEDLAEAIGAATACSKPVSDMEWRPHSEHVGQTGITIRPNLYIAIGISGAIQHQAGVSSSKIIAAINKDPEAPIFKIADYGIVGDAFDVVPRLAKYAQEKVNG